MNTSSQSLAKKERILGYIKDFRELTSQLVDTPNFNPNSKLLDGDEYDGPNTIFYKRLKEEGINFTEITKIDDFVASCISKTGIMQAIGKDQLYHLLIGSPRKPYHDVPTDKLYDDVGQRKENLEVFDDEQVAKKLVELGEEKIAKYFDIFNIYRNNCANIVGDKIVDGHKEFLECHKKLLESLYQIDNRNDMKRLCNVLNKYESEFGDELLYQENKESDILYRYLTGVNATIIPGEKLKHIIDLHDFIDILLLEE